jgi:hypothetical protein
VVEAPYGDGDGPDICGFAGIPIGACKLMFWSSEPRGACGEVRDVIIVLVANGGEIDYNNLIAHVLGFSAEYVVDFDVAVGDVVVMQILHSLADFYENDPSDVPEIVCFVLRAHVFYNFGVTEVDFVQLVPVHDLAQSAQFVDCADFVAAVDYLQTASDVGMLQSFQNVEFVLEDIETVCEISIGREEPLFFEPVQAVNFHCEVLASCSHLYHLAEGSLSQILYNFVLVVKLCVVMTVGSFEFPCFKRDWRQRGVLGFSEGGGVEKSEIFEIIKLFLHGLVVQFLLSVHNTLTIMFKLCRFNFSFGKVNSLDEHAILA